MAERRGQQHDEGFVLHAVPYRETSLLIEAFMRASGRIALVARGARRPRSAMRGLLLAFQRLQLSWTGRGEVRTLTRAEWVGGIDPLRGEALLCGYYLNELLIRLLAREDAHEALFGSYHDALRGLAAGGDTAPVLRGFEKALMRELGYAMPLEHDARDGGAIDAEALYAYDPERGPLRIEASSAIQPRFAGRTLLAIARDDFSDARTLHEAKLLMRALIDHRLDHQPLKSRRIFRELREL